MVIYFITVGKRVTLSLGKCYKGRRLRLKDLNFDKRKNFFTESV